LFRKLEAPNKKNPQKIDNKNYKLIFDFMTPRGLKVVTFVAGGGIMIFLSLTLSGMFLAASITFGSSTSTGAVF
jgi:hypothetical protein